MRYNMINSLITIEPKDASYELIKQYLQENETKALNINYERLVEVIRFLTSQTINSLKVALDVAQLLIFQMQINEEEVDKFNGDLKRARENVDGIISLANESDTELKEYNFMADVVYINKQPQNAFEKLISNITSYQVSCIANSFGEIGQSTDSSIKQNALQKSSTNFMQNYNKLGKSGTMFVNEKQPLLSTHPNQQISNPTQKKSSCCLII